MNEKDQCRVNWHPWRIEQREEALAGQKFADGIEVPDWLRGTAIRAQNCRLENGREDPLAK